MNTQDLHFQLGCYLRSREAAGLKDRRQKRLLEDLIENVPLTESGGSISAKRVIDWACAASPSDAGAGQAFRLSTARLFLIYLRTVFSGIEIPPPNYIKTPRRRPPFLFSHGDIVRMLDLIGTMKPVGSMRTNTYQVLIGLLASAGLRSSEAIRLKISDVQLDVDPPLLYIFETKFLKSRIVPLHSTTANVLRRYLERRKQTLGWLPSDPFFTSSDGKAVSYYTLKNLFARLVERLRLNVGEYQRPPSLHSLRHTFAVRCLTMWYQEGRDVQSLAPHLSVYLGHAHLSDSYWYLSSMPDLLCAAANRFQSFAGKEATDV